MKTEIFDNLVFSVRMGMIFSKIIAHSSSYKRIAIVAHGDVIHNLLHSFLKMPISSEFGFYTGDTGIHLLEINEKGRYVRFLNDTNQINNL